MRWLAVAAFLPGMAAAQDAAEFAGGLERCVHGAQDAAGMRTCIGQPSLACMEGMPGGQSNLGMTDCIRAEAEAWDRLLNSEYRQTMAAAAEMDMIEPAGASRVDQVRAAQRAWIAYRDANCAMQAGYWGEGSMRLPVGASCVLEMTAERTVELWAWRQ